MRHVGALIGVLIWVLTGAAALAQDAWVQIEARPTLVEAEGRVRAYSGVFPDVAGFSMDTGWYAIVLGPYPPAEAQRQLDLLRGERLIPADSYIADPRRFTRRFWPAGGTATGAATPVTALPPSDPAQPEPVPTDPAPTEPVTAEAGASALPDETPAEARRSEALLLPEDRRAIQAALQWQGFYDGAIDGAFGPGTRRSMADWQAATGREATGILTSAERAALIAAVAGERAELGLTEVREEEAGIAITLPLGLVAFDHYEPPFAHFNAIGGSGMRVLLISQKGDQNTLFGLYESLQTLEIVPLSGERNLGRTGFVLSGADDRVHSYSQADLKDGMIKGFTLVWHPGDEARAARILGEMKSSFRPFGDHALDPGLGQPLAEDRAALLAGLEVRRPVLSRSGFYLGDGGLVATTTEVLAGCSRLTIDAGLEVDAIWQDADLGLALLAPRTVLAPPARANLGAATPARRGTEVAVAGYSYGEALDAPVVSFGRLEDLRGLGGETDRVRLSVTTLPGDAGGPVLDAAGALVGMLLPRRVTAGRVLPDDVGFALDAGAIGAALERAGRLGGATEAAEAKGGALAPEDLGARARAMTVLVACWR